VTHWGRFKGHWSVAIRETKWAHPMIARIMLRERLCRKPTDDEIVDQIEALKEKSAVLPPLETIAAAFENGEEVRPVSFGRSMRIQVANLLALQKAFPWKLECEDYEENLQREIAIAFPHHETEPRPKKSNPSANT